MIPPLSLTVLISGRGTNLQALIDACRQGRINARIQAVISDRPGADGLERAATTGLDWAVVDRAACPDRVAFERDLQQTIDSTAPDLIVLAGFMRILSPAFVTGYVGRMINIHPSLLPAYRGLNTHARVIEAGDSVHGASVHFVTPELDGGPVISQATVAVRPGQSAEDLASRLLPVEHRLLVETVALFGQRRVQLRDEKIHVDNKALVRPLGPGDGLGDGPGDGFAVDNAGGGR